MDKAALRRTLVQQRLNMADRLQRADDLQRVMRIWMVDRPDQVIGAYWPIKGEFDPLPVLHRWKEDGELLDKRQRRRIGLPVIDKTTKTMRFHAWYPGRCSTSSRWCTAPHKPCSWSPAKPRTT